MISLRDLIGFVALLGIISCASQATENTSQDLGDQAFTPPTTKNGMVWVPGGEVVSACHVTNIYYLCGILRLHVST